MQHVSTYNGHPQANQRTVIALQGGSAHFGFHMAYSVFIHNVTYIYPTYNSIVNISHIVYKNTVSHIDPKCAQPPCKAITVLSLA